MAKKVTFKKDLELDAQMVFAYRLKNNYELMNLQFKNSSMFPNLETIESRVDWLMTQDDEYVVAVNKKADEIENEK